jgi:ABC-type uncharacterized transport system substrate-binding protein
MTRDGHQAVLTFVLPLAQPQPLAGQTYTFSTFDPTYYVDMSYDKDSDVRCRTRCKNCKIVFTPKPSEETLNFASRWIKKMRRRRTWSWVNSSRRR